MKLTGKLALFTFLIIAISPIAVMAAIHAQVAAGYDFSLALHEDGTVWAWGNNEHGQAGVPGSVEYYTPVQVVGPGGSGHLTGIIAIAAGYNHSLALASDGTIWAWGYNNQGQLGINSYSDSFFPVQVKNTSGSAILTGVKAISSGNDHALALLENGTVLAWGDNSSLQLNDTAGAKSPLPVQCTTPSGIVSIVAGGSHNLVIDDTSMVWAWGNNSSGQLGNGSSGVNSGTAATVKTPDGSGFMQGIVSIGAGNSHSMAIKQDGTGWTWGSNTDGQLGNDSFASSSLPVQVKGVGGTGYLSDISILTGGQRHSLALLNNGNVLAWGENSFAGLLGNGATGYSRVPIQVLDIDSSEPLSNVDAIASSQYHNLALKNNGTVIGWGSNYFGELGNDKPDKRINPVMIEGLSGITAVSGGQQHSLALKNDGTVWSWGNNVYGQLGDGTTVLSSSPKQISTLTGITAISAGDSFSIALKNDGTVLAWGRNEYGQLANGSVDTDPHPTPAMITYPFVDGITSIAAGGAHALALNDSGKVVSWGSNSDGQLGISFTYPYSGPTFVKNASDTGSLTNIYLIASGKNHSMAIDSTLSLLWSWGKDADGQLGNGLPLTDAYLPVLTMNVSGDATAAISDICGGENHSMARLNDDRPWVWGDNYWGQLGDGTKIDRSEEFQLSTPAYTSTVAAGEKHSLALTRDTGSVWAWGYNGSGQLGDGTLTQQLAPVQVPGLSGMTEISAGASHSLAVKDDGTVWTWGSNEYGQLGDGRVWRERVLVEGLNLNNSAPWILYLPAILGDEN